MVKRLVNLAGVLAALVVFVSPVVCIGAKTGGAASSPGGSNPAGGPSTPQNPLIAGYKSFYVVADGPDPNFQAYASELAARYLATAFPNPSVSRMYFVAAPGWTQDTLAAACKTDFNVEGGVVIKFTSFYTDAFWVLYNAETQHITPSFIYVSCWRDLAIQVAPTINVRTIKSPPQVTVPLAPITAIGSLFTFKGTTSTTTAYQVGYGTLALVTAAGALSGNVGVYNPGHEALGVATAVAVDTVVITQSLCGLPPVSNDLLGVQVAYARQNLANGIYPTFVDLSSMLRNEATNFQTKLDARAWTSPSPSPAPIVQTAKLIGPRHRNAAKTKNQATLTPPPTRTATSDILPLQQVCAQIENPR